MLALGVVVVVMGMVEVMRWWRGCMYAGVGGRSQGGSDP